MIFIVLLTYLLLAIYEFVPLYHQKLWREMIVEAGLFGASLTIAILLSLDIKIPSPEAPLRIMFTSVFGK